MKPPPLGPSLVRLDTTLTESLSLSFGSRGSRGYHHGAVGTSGDNAGGSYPSASVQAKFGEYRTLGPPPSEFVRASSSSSSTLRAIWSP